MAGIITTSWSTIQDALATLIATAAPGQKVEVGTPHPDALPGSGVWVWLPLTDAEDSHEQHYEVSSLTAKSESWVQDVVILARMATVDGREVRDKVDTAVLNPMLSAISLDPQLGGLVQLAEVTKVRREEAVPDRTVREHAAVASVAFTVWLQAQ